MRRPTRLPARRRRDPIRGVVDALSRAESSQRDFAEGVWIGKRPLKEFPIQIRIPFFNLGNKEVAHAAVRANGTTITRNRYWLDNGDLVSVTRNVSQRKVVEQELEAKSALLQTLFETLGQPVCVWGADQRLMAYNERFAELMGLEPLMLVGYR